MSAKRSFVDAQWTSSRNPLFLQESEVLPGAQSLQDLDRFNKILAELHLNSEQRAAACSPHNLALLLRAGKHTIRIKMAKLFVFGESTT